MNGRYAAFCAERVRLRPLLDRINDLEGNFILPLRAQSETQQPYAALNHVASSMHCARTNGRNTLFMCGGHVVRSGVQRYLIDLMQRGYIQGIAVNGSVAIHDFEIALQGATTESVAKYIQEGQFGLWEETGHINAVLREGVADGLGFGEALGRELAEGEYPHKNVSLFAAAWRCAVPVTVHVGIGYDIIHAHPTFDGSITGAASHRDFLIFAKLLEKLSCICTFGSAVMAPEIFLKALSMVRNVAAQDGKELSSFSSLVCDLLDIPQDCAREASKADPRYYFRPWKTLLTRTVAGGGQSYYVQGKHADTIPALWQAINIMEHSHE